MTTEGRVDPSRPHEVIGPEVVVVGSMLSLIWLPGHAELMSRVFSFCVYPVLKSPLPYPGISLRQGLPPSGNQHSSPPRQVAGRPQEAPLTLDFSLMQLYLDVCELGPEVFVGSLKGDNGAPRASRPYFALFLDIIPF